MPILGPDLRRTWLFGPGADAPAHEAMQRSGADALIVDLEDFTPPERREAARRLLANLLQRWRDAGRIAVVRINALDTEGPTDLAVAMPAGPDVTRAHRRPLGRGADLPQRVAADRAGAPLAAARLRGV